MQKNEVICTYIGFDDFLKEKCWKFIYAQIWFFVVWLLISFNIQFISFFSKEGNSTIEQEKCKCHEKLDRCLASEVDFNVQFS